MGEGGLGSQPFGPNHKNYIARAHDYMCHSTAVDGLHHLVTVVM